MLRSRRPHDRRAERVEERIRRVEEVDRRRPVVHRHDEARPERPDDPGSRLAADRRAAARGHEEDVDLADRLLLLGPERRLAEVAEMADSEPVEGEPEDRVLPALRPRDGVVLGGDADDLADRRSNVPAVERITAGEPPTASTPCGRRARA